MLLESRCPRRFEAAVETRSDFGFAKLIVAVKNCTRLCSVPLEAVVIAASARFCTAEGQALGR